MSELSADARAVIAQGKVLAEPSAADRARVRQKLAASWAASGSHASVSEDLREPTAFIGNASSERWLWGALITTALGAVLALWIGLRASPAHTRSTAQAAETSSQPAPTAVPINTTPINTTPIDTAPNAEAAYAHNPEPVLPTTPVVRRLAGESRAASSPAKAGKRVQSNAARARPSAALARADETLDRSLDDLVPAQTPATVAVIEAPSSAITPQPSNAPQPLAASPTPTARDSSRHEATTPSERRLVARPDAAPHSAQQTPRPAPANDVAPPQSAPKFVAQPIDDELALLGAAQEALQDHKPSLALRLVQHHGFRFPRGALAQERIAVETLALCALHRLTEAKQMLSELSRRAPNSPLLAHVALSCGFGRQPTP